MNCKLSLKDDYELLSCLNRFVETNYLTEEEEEHCLNENAIPFELLETIKMRIEIDQNPRAKCKSDQVLILKGLSLFSLIN